MKKFLLSFLFIFILCGSGFVDAADPDDVEKPEPNIYQKKDVELNINLRDRINKKEQISENQQELTFERNNQSDTDEMKEMLFLTTSKEETNVIKAKSEKIGLFTNQVQETPLKDEEEQITNTTPYLLYTLTGLVVVGCLALPVFCRKLF